MKTVSPFEARMLRLLQLMLQPGPALAPTRAKGDLARPPCLSRAAVELVQDHLSKGVIHLIARQGWQHERYLRGEQIRLGRLWERSDVADLPLVFSRHALELLCRVAAQPAELEDFDPPPSEWTVADRLLLLFAYRSLQRTEVSKNLVRLQVWREDGLFQLMFPEEVSEQPVEIDWAPWTGGLGSCILEAWQAALTQRWLEVAQTRVQWTNTTKMQAQGNHQGRILDSFLAALERVGRWDLAQFLLRFFGEVLARQPTGANWIGALNVSQMRLSDRSQIYRAALVPLAGLTKLQAWQQQARSIGYFEEGYAASQLWKSLWETQRGDELCAHAERIRREVEPLG